MKNSIVKANFKEMTYLVRYAGNGIINTIIGFIIIFTAMEIGFSPILSNILGYISGLIIGFLVSKKIIFKSDGSFVVESIMYLCSFTVAFSLNLVALYLMINIGKWRDVPSQFFAGIIYSVVMYSLSRLLVFSSKRVSNKFVMRKTK